MTRPCAAAVLALAFLPALAAAAAADYRREAPSLGHECGSQGTYAPGSAYEASLRVMAASVPAEANGFSCKCSPGNLAGERPDLVSASAYCYWRPDGSTVDDCGACIAMAFREAQRLCPYHRQATVVVDGGGCGVSFHDVQRMEQGIGVGNPGLDGDISLLNKLCPHAQELALNILEQKLLEDMENFTGHFNQVI